MLNGIDISHHNSNMVNPHDLNLVDFVIMKATEGFRFKDPKLDYYMRILDKERLYGFYHFARPDLGNDPEVEAFHFIETVRRYISDRSILALDVEANALNCGNLDAWCSTWAQIVDIETGILPMIYCSQAECKRFPATAALGCGLWVAKWSKNKPTQKQIDPWKFFAIWQWTSQGNFSGVRCDLDFFNGTREQYMKYCKVD